MLRESLTRSAGGLITNWWKEEEIEVLLMADNTDRAAINAQFSRSRHSSLTSFPLSTPSTLGELCACLEDMESVAVVMRELDSRSSY